jgi:hypothetical protein
MLVITEVLPLVSAFGRLHNQRVIGIVAHYTPRSQTDRAYPTNMASIAGIK